MIRSTTCRTVCCCAIWVSVWACAGPASAQPAAAVSLPVPELQADPAIPSIQAITGQDWAAHITSHAELERYLDALVKAAPDRMKLERYGESYEGRGLYYLVISSAENMQRLEEIRQAHLQLAESPLPPGDQGASAIAQLPAIVWLAASVHGNELSSTEAALLAAYHLLADQGPATRQLLERLVILVDPLQNPDGRARFLSVYSESRGRFDSSHPLATERVERWPGGRFNHYLFDLNRDWFLQSQQESRYKVRAYRHWQPHLYIDAHEMGHNSMYFFVPPGDPLNPFMLHTQKEWLWKLGSQQAEWFDRYGFAYTTREMFDGFFPGYGSEWPNLHGGLGVLWEQAGVRGLLVDRDDELTLHYRDAVLHHYLSMLATLELAAAQREQLLADFHAACRRGVQLGEEGPVKYYVLPSRQHRDRTRKLVQLLQNNGIRVDAVARTFRVAGTDMRSGRAVDRAVSPGSYIVPVAQRTGRLVRTLLDRHTPMDEDYVREQLARKADHLPDQIYDVTAWSLPLAFDLPCVATRQSLAPEVMSELSADESAATPDQAQPLPPARVAYLVRPTDGALTALSRWLQEGLRVHVTDEPFVLADRQYPRGTLIVKTHGNPPQLRDVLQASAQQLGISIAAADTGLVASGAHFGGPHVKWVRPPRILLAMDQPTSYSVGHTWYVLDHVLQYPTTRISCQHLPQLDLSQFNVLILPAGQYSQAPGFNAQLAEQLRVWLDDGGTLVLVAHAAVWASQDEIGLLKLRRVSGPAAPPGDPPQGSPAETKADESASLRPLDNVPGAFLRAEVFRQHWLTFGCPAALNVFAYGDIFFEPLAIEDGRNLIAFTQQDPLVAAGFCWPTTAQVLPGKTWLAYRPVGKGHVVAFATDPNYRAMYPSLQRLFLNACLFGPGQ